MNFFFSNWHRKNNQLQISIRWVSHRYCWLTLMWVDHVCFGSKIFWLFYLIPHTSTHIEWKSQTVFLLKIIHYINLQQCKKREQFHRVFLFWTQFLIRCKNCPLIDRCVDIYSMWCLHIHYAVTILPSPCDLIKVKSCSSSHMRCRTRIYAEFLHLHFHRCVDFCVYQNWLLLHSSHKRIVLFLFLCHSLVPRMRLAILHVQ